MSLKPPQVAPSTSTFHIQNLPIHSTSSLLTDTTMLSRSTPRLASLLRPTLRAYSSNVPTPATPSSRVDDQPNSSSTTERLNDKITTNDPQPPKNPPNVSASNETPVSMMGIKTGTLQESREEGEKNRVMQAPNRATTWSRSQQPKERAMRGPRFEQTIMELQVSGSSPLKVGIKAGVYGQWRARAEMIY